MSTLMYASVVGAAANLLIVGALLYVYGSSYQKMRTSFTLGLLVFAGLFLLQNAITLFSFITMMPIYAAGVDLQVALFTWVQTVGLGALVVTTWR
ncbi:MAG: hypothetical protein ACE5EW_06890 [Thermoplasmata archaeon]